MANNLSVFDIAGRAMSAQMMRLNTTASNLANAGAVASSKEEAFRSIKPVFKSVTDAPGIATVKVDSVVATKADPTKRHDPSNPKANKDGDVWEAAVDQAQELVEMMETSRQYQNNVQVMQTAKTLTLDTLRIGK